MTWSEIALVNFTVGTSIVSACLQKRRRESTVHITTKSVSGHLVRKMLVDLKVWGLNDVIVEACQSSPRSWAASKLRFHRWSNSTVKSEGFLWWKARWSNVGVSSQAKTYDLRDIRGRPMFSCWKIYILYCHSLNASSVIDFGNCLLWGMCRDPKAVSMQVTTCWTKMTRT